MPVTLRGWRDRLVGSEQAPAGKETRARKNLLRQRPRPSTVLPCPLRLLAGRGCARCCAIASTRSSIGSARPGAARLPGPLWREGAGFFTQTGAARTRRHAAGGATRPARFDCHCRHHRQRGKKANTGILIVARRMCRIVWHLLREQRNFEKRPSAAQTNPVPGCPSAMSSGPNGSGLRRITFFRLTRRSLSGLRRKCRRASGRWGPGFPSRW